MIIGVPKETFPGEQRVALTPPVMAPLAKAGFEVIVEAGAGENAGFSDAEFTEKGAMIEADRAVIFDKAGVIVQVRAGGANPSAGAADIERLRRDQVLIGLMQPLDEPKSVATLADTGAISFALELLPRISRAQSMDVLSSMAMIAGYKAVLLAAGASPRMFPMMMTAAGTVKPAIVFVVGAGVAGLQAMSTARRLGGVVKAIDVRAAVKEEVQSVGAEFIEINIEQDSDDAGGGKGAYAKAQDEAFYVRQRELMAEHVATSDIVITTAAIPGRRSPMLISAEMVASMRPGAVIVDLAAEGGGNCELTQAGETIREHGVIIAGPTNIASTVPYHASLMYSRNITKFLLHLYPEGELKLDREEEIVQGTLLTHQGQVVQPRIRELLGLPTGEPAEKDS